MRRYLTICALLVSACGENDRVEVRPDPPIASADLFEPCPGWMFGPPDTEGQWSEAAAAEQSGRLCANQKLATLRAIHLPE